MKPFKNFKHSFYCAAVLSLLFTSCSEQRYTYYQIDKKNTAKVTLDQPAVIEAAPATAFTQVTEQKEKTPVAAVNINKETAAVKTGTKKRTRVKNVTKAIDQAISAPSKTLAQVPAKIMDVFASNSSTTGFKAENSDGNAGLLWTIIIIVLILWLLGFLVGDVGGLIHLLLVIALILIILHLLGAI